MLPFLKFRARRSEPVPAADVQIREGQRHPFGLLRDFTPLGGGDVRLYRAVREAVPVVDAAVYKLVRLAGGVSVCCESPLAQDALREFLRTVPVGRGQFGINAFLDCYLDSLLTCGRAVGEIVPAAEGLEIAALLCGDVENIVIKEGDHPLKFSVCASDGLGGGTVLPRQDLILFTPLNPESANPYGVSFLRGLPFLADILMKIYHSVGVNWERCGNVRFAVTCKNADGSAAQKGRVLADEWARAMRDGSDGRVSDFVAVGDVDIKVIGGDAPVLDSSVPVRQILEQIVAKTGIPPFMLGLSWSATERMSTQQADLLTTEITALRRALAPAVDRICSLWLRMHGFACPFQVLWDDINLQDQVEEARAELFRQQARKLALDNDAVERSALNS